MATRDFLLVSATHAACIPRSPTPLLRAHMAGNATISLLQLGPVIFGGTDGIISFLQGKGLLAQQLTCHRCSVAMNIARRASLTDGHAFRCPQCHTYTSLRSGSFCEKSRLPLQKWILLMYLWVREYPIKDAQEEAEVAHETAVSIYIHLNKTLANSSICSELPVIEFF